MKLIRIILSLVALAGVFVYFKACDELPVTIRNEYFDKAEQAAAQISRGRLDAWTFAELFFDRHVRFFLTVGGGYFFGSLYLAVLAVKFLLRLF